MAPNRKRPLRGNAPRVLVEPPIIVRLCESFVDNLGIFLKTAFVFGSFFLVQDLLTGLAETQGSAPRSTQILEADRLEERGPAQQIVVSPADHASEDGSFLSDGVQHAFNCTFAEYRNAHYDDCVGEASDVYRPPTAEPNDRGYLGHEHVVLFAKATANEPPRDF